MSLLYFWVGCHQNALFPDYPGVQYSLFSFFGEEIKQVNCVKTIAEGFAKKKKSYFFGLDMSMKQFHVDCCNHITVSASMVKCCGYVCFKKNRKVRKN